MKRSSTLLVIALLAAHLTSAQQVSEQDEKPKSVELTSNKVVVPISIYANKPVVEVTINGKGPYSLFLDTGAGGTFLDQTLSDELRLPSTGTMKIGDPADPNALEVKRDQIGEMRIGGAAFKNFICVASDRSGLYKPGAPRGVIGIPVFHDVLVTIDYPNKQLVLERGSLPVADDKRVLNMKHEPGGIYSVAISVNGARMDAHVDTGSAGAITMPAELMDKMALRSKPVERGRGRTVGGEMVIYAASLAGEFAVGDLKLVDPEIVFFGRLRTPNLGYGFLSRFAITLDQVNLRFRFAGPGTAPDPSPKTGSTDLSQYAGNYRERTITVENGALYLQRTSGPRGAGPKIRLAQVRPGDFALDGQTEVRVRFDGQGKMSVLTPEGQWETAKRN